MLIAAPRWPLSNPLAVLFEHIAQVTLRALRAFDSGTLHGAADFPEDRNVVCQEAICALIAQCPNVAIPGGAKDLELLPTPQRHPTSSVLPLG